MRILGDNFFSKYKTSEDFTREREEFEARKRIGELKTMQLEKQAMQPEQLSPEQLIAKSIQMGGIGNLSPQEQAQLQAYDTIRTSTMAQNPMTGGVYAKHRSILDMMPGQINQMPPSEAMGMPTRSDTYRAPNYTPEQADEPVRMPTAEPNLQGAPAPAELTRGGQAMPTVPAPQPTITPPDTTGLYLPGQQSVLQKTANANIDAQSAEAAPLAKRLGEARAQYNEMQANMPKLQDMLGRLRGLSEVATFTPAGQIVDNMARGVGYETEGDVARNTYSTIIDNEILPQLRQTFGAQFTAEEGKALKATLGNVDLGPKAKQAALDAFITNKITQVQSLEREMGLPVNDYSYLLQPARMAPIDPAVQQALDKYLPAGGR